MKYSIIIPVFNGAKTIKILYEKIHKVFYSYPNDYEIIFVYDCGDDESWDILVSIKQVSSIDLKIIKLSRNYGQHNALICGFEQSNGDFLVTLDEDLQHDPNDIHTLIAEQAKANYDVVYGVFPKLKFGIFRRFTSKILRWMIYKGLPEIHPDYSAFRLIKRQVALSMVDMRNSYTFLDGYISWLTSNIGSCIVSHNCRLAGKSSYSISKLINHSVNIFVTFSNWPIRILTKASFLLFIFVIVYSFYILYRKLIYDDLALGFPTLVIAIGLGFSIVMMALAVIGEYIYRINLKSTRRPNYHIDKIL